MREQNNLIRRTKLKVLILAVTALTTSFPVAAQQGNITLPVRTLNAEEVFENIHKQTAYKVAANGTQTAALTVKVTRASNPIRTILDRMLEGSGMGYRMSGDYIVISPAIQAPAAVTVNRNVAGTVTDSEGTPLEGVTVEFVDIKEKQAATTTHGRFQIGDVPSGNHIVKLTTADGASVRYREITVPQGSDAEVTLKMGGELMTASASNTTAPAEQSKPKTTRYFVPNVQDNTIQAFADEPKTSYSLTPETSIGGRNYMPKAAVKTNLLYLATTSLNVAAEFGLAKKWTLDIAAGINTWDLNDRKGGIRHWLVQPEVRYWFCQRFEKHFIGLHGIGGQYQISDIDLSPFGNDLTGKRYDGWGIGGGVSYGYHLPMSKRWSWEFTVGVGYIYLDYNKYNCGECDNLIGSRKKHYFGPTKAGISLIYMIK